MKNARSFCLTILLFAGLLNPAHAESNYETPQYSGPGAAIEHGMNRNGNPSPTQSDRAPLYHNDKSFEAQTTSRHENITGEMDRRRDDAVRANRRSVLKFNE